MAYITSIGEPTTDLCRWVLQRNGFKTTLIERDTPLADKLEEIYHIADDDFVRIDADVVPNKNLSPEFIGRLTNGFWWYQFLTFDWFKQDTTHGGVQLIKKEAIPVLKAHISRFKDAERPESQMYRLEEFHEPRRCKTIQGIMGIHGYGQKDIKRIKKTKERRNQNNYDWELAEKLAEL